MYLQLNASNNSFLDREAAVNASEYYRNTRVLAEISDFLKGRWAAFHCEKRLRDGRPILLRYHSGRPLKASSVTELSALLRKLAPLKPRAIYGTASLYEKLEKPEDTRNMGLVTARTLTWDIDSTPEHWRVTVEAARAIVDVLEKHGVVESVWLKWSGRGMHVHVHEAALSGEFLRRQGVLDATWSVVEYVANKVKEKILEMNIEHGSSIKVENLMDPQRVFTAPLSLHRQLDSACIALKPEDLDSFEPGWADPRSPKHNPAWRQHVSGEAEELAEVALREVGGYLGRGKRSQALRRFLGELSQEKPAEHKPAPVLEEVYAKPNLTPAPLERRDLRGDPRRAVRYLEDVLGHLMLGNISREKALFLLRAAADVTIKTQGYALEDVERLAELFRKVIERVEKGEFG